MSIFTHSPRPHLVALGLFKMRSQQKTNKKSYFLTGFLKTALFPQQQVLSFAIYERPVSNQVKDLLINSKIF